MKRLYDRELRLRSRTAGRRPDPAQAGWSLAEALAAIALLSVTLTASYGVLYRARAISTQIENASLRVAAAERVMERTLAIDPEQLASRTVDLPPREVDGRRGWTASVRVTRERPRLTRVAVTVGGGGGETSLRTLVAIPGAMP